MPRQPSRKMFRSSCGLLFVNRVEAMADSDGRSDIDLDFYKSAKQAMAPS